MARKPRNKPGITEEPKTESATHKPLELTIEDIDAKTLVGDVRDYLLQEARSTKKLQWNERSEREQQEFIDRTTAMARSLIGRVVEQIATRGREVIRVSSGGFTVKDDMKITLRAPHTRANGLLMVDAGSYALHLVFVPVQDFDGERSSVQAQPDQQSLAYGADAREEETEDRALFDSTPAGAA